MADSPASSLSSILSDDIPDDPKLDENEHASMTPNMPASKRRRIGNSSWDRHTPVSSIHDEVMPGSPTSTISSDTSGDVPNTPTTGLGSSIILEEDFGPGNEQVTVCKWDGCDAGDLGNMDDLVKHIHDDHIMPRQKKYSCEWSDCSRKGMSHASGYALRAHMRSHTREKPFYCALPECDRSFTRSDALAKHMRTVHETEALRPSDPIPKGYPPPSAAPGNAGKAGPRIKLKMPGASSASATSGDAVQDTDIENDMDADSSFPLPEFPSDLGFDEEELGMRPSALYRLLRRQVYWAELEGKELKQEADAIEVKRRLAWKEKDAVFNDMTKTEVKFAGVTTADIFGNESLPTAEKKPALEDGAISTDMDVDEARSTKKRR